MSKSSPVILAAYCKANLRFLEADPDLLVDTLSCLLKTREDRNAIAMPAVEAILAGSVA